MSLGFRRFLFVAGTAIVLFATFRYAVEFRHTQLYGVQTPKTKFKKRETASLESFQGKATGFFQVESSVKKIPGSRVLVFEVKANQDVFDARLKWHLPAAAQIVNGAEELVIGSLTKGETRIFELEVADLAGRAAFAEIFTFRDGMKFGATAPFSDMPSHSLMKFDSGKGGPLNLGGPSRLIQ